MHPFPAAAIPLRATGAPYMAAAPAPPVPLKAHKAASVVQGAHGARIVVAADGAGRVTHHTPTAVPPAVTAAPTPTNSKIQPQLQNLPRFKPPCFETANGVLPTPESPGSTPRNDRCHDLELELAAGPEEVSSEKSGPYPVGSIVEYRSRSSGQWILAKVEGFDEANNTYRLDVQPHANPERVRPRGGGLGVASAPVVTEQPDVAPHAGEVTTYSAQPATPPRPTRGESCSARPGGVETELVSPYTDLKELPARRSCTSVVTTAACQLGEPSPLAEVVDPSVAQLLIEVEALRNRVARLQAENEQLHEQVAVEAGLKERYLQELRAFHEQQRVRGTPR